MSLEQLLEEAKFYFVTNRYDEAEKLFKKILEEDPNNKDALYNLALLYEVTNQIDLAKTYFEKLLRIEPDNEEVRKRLDKLTEL